MNISIEFLLTSGVVLIVILVGIIFLIPGERREKRKSKKSQEEIAQQNKDLEQKVLRLEKYISSLRESILTLQKNAKTNEKELMVERVKVKKFQEKLTQEREWYKKEQGAIDKKGKESQQLKEELEKVQESFSKEHALNIRFEREIKELKQRGVVFEDYDLPGFKTVNHVCVVGSDKAAWFKDPEGNILCVHETRP